MVRTTALFLFLTAALLAGCQTAPVTAPASLPAAGHPAAPGPEPAFQQPRAAAVPVPRSRPARVLHSQSAPHYASPIRPARELID